MNFCTKPSCPMPVPSGMAFCPDHTPGGAVAAKAAIAAAEQAATVPTGVGLRDFEYCSAPACIAAATSKWHGLDLCETHGQYGTFVRKLERDRRWLFAWLMVDSAIILVLAGKNFGWWG